MIPYDDLVVALQTWRAKQGLPVAQLSGALTPPPMQVKPPVAVAPIAQPGSGPARAAPPMAPPPRPAQPFLGDVATPPPLASVEDSLDVEDAALIEESHYENEGDDFAMAFAAGGATGDHDGESTSIGSAPGVTDPGGTMTDDAPLKPKHNRNEDW